MATRLKTTRWSVSDFTTDRNNEFDSVFIDDAGVFTDETDDASDSGTNDVTFQGTSGDRLYLGSGARFAGFYVVFNTNPAGGTRTWEYWNGSTWTSLTLNFVTGNANLTATTSAYFTLPSDWATTTVNGASRYWIRGTVGTGYSTAGSANVIVPFLMRNLIDNNTGSNVTLKAEGGSRTFKSVILRVYAQSPVLQQMDGFYVRIKIGSAAWSDTYLVNGNAVTAATETIAYILHFDCTSEFTSNFTGTSHAIQVEGGWLLRGAMANATENYEHWHAEFWMTYEFDDTQATQYNTVVLGADSLTGALTTSQATIGGTGGIPILTGGSGILKENSPTIEDLYLIYRANANEGGTTNWAFVGQIDSETETTLVNYNAANNSDYPLEVLWRRTDLTTTSAHDVKARVTSTSGATCANIGFEVTVTYSFTLSGTTTATHTMVMPIAHNPYFFRGTTANDAAATNLKFYIEDVSPSLVNGAVCLYPHQFSDPGSYLVALGSQTARSYSVPPDATSGPAYIGQRFDSGAAAGSGMTFGRGLNTLTLKTYVDTTPANGGGEYGYVLLTYTYTVTSGKRPSHAALLARSAVLNALSSRATASWSIGIPETSYYVAQAGQITIDMTAENKSAKSFSVQKGNGDGQGVFEGITIAQRDSGHGMSFAAADISRVFKRCPTETDAARVDIETSRSLIWEGSTGYWSSVVFVNWHDYAIAVTRASTGYDSTGSGITVDIYSIALGEKIASVTTSSGGGYAFTWYDNTSSDLFAVARQDSTHVARSDNFTAS